MADPVQGVEVSERHRSSLGWKGTITIQWFMERQAVRAASSLPHTKEELMLFRRALISVSDKTGIVEFAEFLSGRGVEILSTGGTAKLLQQNKIPVIEVSEFTKSPEMLGGRVKTLHPKIHGGLLGIRDDEVHQREMRENGIEPIDLLVVNLYPFEQTIARKDCTFEIDRKSVV